MEAVSHACGPFAKILRSARKVLGPLKRNLNCRADDRTCAISLSARSKFSVSPDGPRYPQWTLRASQLHVLDNPTKARRLFYAAQVGVGVLLAL